MFQKFKSLKGKFRYDDSEMPFLQHLEEFRKTVIRAVIALIVGLLLCLPFADKLIGVLRAPAEPYIEKNASELLEGAVVLVRIPVESFDRSEVVGEETNACYVVEAQIETLPVAEKKQMGVIRLQFSEPAAAIKMWLTVSFVGGLLVSLPVLVFIIGSFVMPGIRDVERRILGRISIFSGGLFLLGITMGYKITLPLALDLMLRVGGRLGGESIWFYSKYIGFALQLLLGFGLAFQLPVVVLILGKMGIVNSRQLREKRRHVIVGLLVLAMALTPPDIMTQLLMAAPLILLYECCIWFLHFSGNREPAKDTTEQDETANDENKTNTTSEE